MLDKDSVIPTVLAKLDKLPVSHALELRTYKRNRSVLMVKKSSETYLVRENGFYQDQFTVSRDKLKKSLKALLKREFPRSRKVRLYQLGPWDENEDELPPLKTL